MTEKTIKSGTDYSTQILSPQQQGTTTSSGPRKQPDDYLLPNLRGDQEKIGSQKTILSLVEDAIKTKTDIHPQNFTDLTNTVFQRHLKDNSFDMGQSNSLNTIYNLMNPNIRDVEGVTGRHRVQAAIGKILADAYNAYQKNKNNNTILNMMKQLSGGILSDSQITNLLNDAATKAGSEDPKLWRLNFFGHIVSSIKDAAQKQQAWDKLWANYKGFAQGHYNKIFDTSKLPGIFKHAQGYKDMNQYKAIGNDFGQWMVIDALANTGF
jgi:hypothetical protein